MFSRFRVLRISRPRQQRTFFQLQQHGQGQGQRDLSLSFSSKFDLRARSLRKMSTFKLTGKELGLSLSENEKLGELNVEVTLKDDLTKEELLEFPAFKVTLPFPPPPYHLSLSSQSPTLKLISHQLTPKLRNGSPASPVPSPSNLKNPTHSTHPPIL